MPIRFRCPGCKKILSVKEHLAGKRLPCPSCKHIVTIPQPRKAAAPADVEELAAAALTTVPTEEQPKEQKKIKFACSYCDEELEYDVDMGGKREQCPHCKNINVIPKPEVEKPKDWRTANKSGRMVDVLLKDNQITEGMETAWGSQTDKSNVSRGTLEETGQLPEEEEEPLPVEKKVSRWLGRGFLTIVAAAALVGGYFWFSAQRTQTIQEGTLARAEESLQQVKDNPKMLRGWEAAYHQALGEFYAQAEKPKPALDQFRLAVSKFRGATGKQAIQPDEELLLIELAQAIIPLGGDENQVIDKIRISWEEVAKELERTVSLIRSEEAQMLALRRINQRLLKVSQAAVALTLTNQIASSNRRSALAAEQVALLMALDKEEQAKKLVPEPGKQALTLTARLGYAQGWAQQGKCDEAIKLAQTKPGSSVDRIASLLAVAAAALDKQQTVEATTALEEAHKVLQEYLRFGRPAPLYLYHMAELTARLKSPAEAKNLIARIRHDGLQAYAQLAVLRFQNENSSSPIDPSQITNKETLAYGLAQQIAARQKTDRGQQAAVLASLESSDDIIRPLIWSGMVQAMREPVE